MVRVAFQKIHDCWSQKVFKNSKIFKKPSDFLELMINWWEIQWGRIWDKTYPKHETNFFCISTFAGHLKNSWGFREHIVPTHRINIVENFIPYITLNSINLTVFKTWLKNHKIGPFSPHPYVSWPSRYQDLIF